MQVYDTHTISNKYGCKVLVYGNAGVGKTRLSASAPKPFILSAENGLLSLRSFNIPYAIIKSLADLKEAYAYLTTGKGQEFHTIILDSISEIAEVVLNFEKSLTKDPRKAYGETQDAIISEFRKFRDIQFRHVVFIAKMEYSTDQVTGAKSFQPSFPGNKLAQAAPYFFDEVFQLNTFDDPTHGRMRLFRTQPDLYNQAKDRSGTLSEWENADPATGGGLSYIFQKMMAV